MAQAEAVLTPEERAMSEQRQRDVEAIEEIESRFNTLGWRGYYREAKEKNISSEIVNIYPRHHIEGLIQNGEMEVARQTMENSGIQISEEETRRLLESSYQKFIDQGRSDKTFKIMKHWNIGTEEEQRQIGEQAIGELIKDKFYISAREIAEQIYGKETPEYENIVQKIKETSKKQPWKLIRSEDELSIVRLNPEATMGDLFEALASDTESTAGGPLLEDRFWMEVFDNFIPEVSDALFDAQERPELRSMKATDFFKQQKISEKDASVFLPIRFSKKKGGSKK